MIYARKSMQFNDSNQLFYFQCINSRWNNVFDFRFAKIVAVKEHFITKHALIFQCSICEKTFMNSKTLKTHVQRIHEPDRERKRDVKKKACEELPKLPFKSIKYESVCSNRIGNSVHQPKFICLTRNSISQVRRVFRVLFDRRTFFNTSKTDTFSSPIQMHTFTVQRELWNDRITWST